MQTKKTRKSSTKSRAKKSRSTLRSILTPNNKNTQSKKKSSSKEQESKKIAPLTLSALYTSTDWFDEPCLLFADGQTHSDPKVGIPLYGPRSLGTSRHKREVHIGFIGTGESVGKAQEFYVNCAKGVDGDEENAPFPGCSSDAGYRVELKMDSTVIEPITRQEQLDILSIKHGRERFEKFLGLLDSKLKLLTQKDHPLDYIVFAISNDLYQRCRAVDYIEKGLGKVHRDLHRAFKGIAMRYQKATQIIQEPTASGISSKQKQLDHLSRIAWNLFTGMYFKVDGLPWGPIGLPQGSCYIGISFFRPLGSISTLRTSVVQAFDENGEGLVLRGHDFHWDEQEQGKSPHLTEELAAKLIHMVLDRYEEERKQPPQRVIVHKSSRYEKEEREGFEAALKRVKQYDLVALTPASDVRLIRTGKYPPIRGTSFTVGEVSYLYTSGYISQLGYPHGHVPSPLQIADHIGDTTRKQLIMETLILTKMNWNSANLSGLLPITLRFSRLVGNILREIPSDLDPLPKYKFYM